ncbi:MAG TPA: hypothetical protein EYH45_05000 [Candidatus Caldiarchaeum subterraneum]|uniref:RING-type domain-containing protein n=1 Tax=Caldiarchaeum subterraneum TaxID=311458 RepID=A0A832ZW08_CALS0|nr:hypothetical protein [Candidatus Caldarchaeum subterraneum]
MIKVVVRKGRSLGFWNPFEDATQQNNTQTNVETCIICMNELRNSPTFTCPYCKATGHWVCFDRWLTKRNTCPLCYKEIILQ